MILKMGKLIRFFILVFLLGLISTLILLALFKNKKAILKELFASRPNKAPIKVDGFK